MNICQVVGSFPYQEHLEGNIDNERYYVGGVDEDEIAAIHVPPRDENVHFVHIHLRLLLLNIYGKKLI